MERAKEIAVSETHKGCEAGSQPLGLEHSPHWLCTPLLGSVAFEEWLQEASKEAS